MNLRFLRRKRVKVVVLGRTVETKYGCVEGARLVNDDDCKIDAFLGIPYAKPPIGCLRFKKPEPPNPWKDVRKAVSFGPRAPQKDFIWDRWSTTVKTDEDCLYLNVFSPSWSPPDDQPDGFAVMVFVHGGGFVVDSSVKYGDIEICNNLCRRNVVIVTIQYRLGLLGFFCTGNDTCPGNNGLWDQTLALQWVKENISAFNGNPKNITVFGQSAGGASCDLLSLSPKSRDLFQRVIPMAGNADCLWAITDVARIVEFCRRFAQKHGWHCNQQENDDQAMLEFLRKLPAKSFERGLFGRDGVNSGQLGLDLAPVIDGDFLPKSVEELRRESPSKCCMIGTCTYEGLIFAAFSKDRFTLRGIDKLLATYIPKDKYQNYQQMRDEARQWYLQGVDQSNKTAVAKAFTNLHSDLFINSGVESYVRTMYQNGHTIYLYSFDHFNPRSFGLLSFWLPFKGASHCTEIAYIFGVSIIAPYKFDKLDEHVKDTTATLWTNFAKYGDPNSCGTDESTTTGQAEWLPVTADAPNRYLSISTECRMMDSYYDDRNEIWRRLGMIV